MLFGRKCQRLIELMCLVLWQHVTRARVLTAGPLVSPLCQDLTHMVTEAPQKARLGFQSSMPCSARSWVRGHLSDHMVNVYRSKEEQKRRHLILT